MIPRPVSAGDDTAFHGRIELETDHKKESGGTFLFTSIRTVIDRSMIAVTKESPKMAIDGSYLPRHPCFTLRPEKA